MSKPMEDPPSLVDILVREHAARRLLIEAEAASVLLASEMHAEAAAPAEANVTPVVDSATGEISAPVARASTPRVLVEELTRKCCERRAALDDEARRG